MMDEEGMVPFRHRQSAESVTIHDNGEKKARIVDAQGRTLKHAKRSIGFGREEPEGAET